MYSYERQQAREAAILAESDIIIKMNNMSICRICDDTFISKNKNDTCCDDCRLPNGQKLETIDDVLGVISSNKAPVFYAETEAADNTDLVICEKCGQTFTTSDDSQDYCLNCRN